MGIHLHKVFSQSWTSYKNSRNFADNIFLCEYFIFIQFFALCQVQFFVTLEIFNEMMENSDFFFIQRIFLLFSYFSFVNYEKKIYKKKLHEYVSRKICINRNSIKNCIAIFFSFLVCHLQTIFYYHFSPYCKKI